MEGDDRRNGAMPVLDQPLFTVQCVKHCLQSSEPQPTREAMRDWLERNRWGHIDGKARCPLCMLAARPNQGDWGSSR